MRIAFLDPLEARLSEFPARYLAGHDVITASEPGKVPEGIEAAEAIVWWSYPLDAELIESLPSLRFLQRIGYLRAKGDATAALRKGLPVSVLPFGVSDRVALHALALTLAVLRKIVAGHQAVLEGVNPDNLPEAEGSGPPAVNWARIPDVDTINDKTVGIVGFGEIGACLARMLTAFNTRTLYYKRSRLTPEQERYYGVEYASLEDLLRHSDIVEACLPYSESTRKLLGAREFALMQPGSIIVNVGRGPTLDEEALVEALRSRHIAWAGLDVFHVEPLPRSSPLLELDNVVLAPHTAGGIQGWINTFQRIAENLRRVEAGSAVINPLSTSDPQPGVS